MNLINHSGLVNRKIIAAWDWISTLGVTNNGNEQDKRRTILSNRINFSLVIIFLWLEILVIFVTGKFRISNTFITLIICLFNLFLSYKGHCKVSKLSLCTVPLAVLLIFPVIMGEVNNRLLLWYAYGVICFSLFPQMVFSIKSEKPFYVSALLFLFFLLLFAERILLLNTSELTIWPLIDQDFLIIKSIHVALFLIINVSFFYYVNQSTNYQIALLERAEIINEQAQELLTNNEKLAEANQQLSIYKDNLEEQVAIRTSDLKESENRFRAMFESSRDAINVSSEGIMLYANPAFIMLFGYHEEADIKDRPILDIIAPSHHEKVNDYLNRHSNNEGVSTFFEIKGRKKDGTEFDQEVSIATFSLHNKIYSINIIRDITERKQAEEKLKLSEEKFSKAFNTSLVALSISRLSDGLFLDCNEALTNILGYSRTDLLGKSSADLGIWENIDQRDAILDVLFTQGIIKNQETRFMGKTGNLITTLFSCVLIDFNNTQCLLSVFDDITEQKKAEEALSQSDEKFRNIFSKTGDGVIICKFNNNIALTNNSFASLLGYTVDEITGSSIQKYLPPEQFEQMKDQLAQVNTNELQPTEFTGIKKDGSQVYVQINASLIDYEGEKAAIIVVRDITEKKLENKKINSASILAEENERSRLAKELHDGLGPLLSAAKIYTYNIQNSKETSAIEKHLEKLECIIDEALISVKEISNNISPHVLRNFGLIKAIKNFLSKLVFNTKINLNIYLDETKRYPEVYEITIYRAVTELLNNTYKYAKAQNLYISVKEENCKFQLWYCDDGVGFNFEETIQAHRGLGLFNILSRINSLGGYIKFDSNHGKGMSVYMEFNC